MATMPRLTRAGIDDGCLETRGMKRELLHDFINHLRHSTVDAGRGRGRALAELRGWHCRGRARALGELRARALREEHGRDRVDDGALLMAVSNWLFEGRPALGRAPP